MHDAGTNWWCQECGDPHSRCRVLLNVECSWKTCIPGSTKACVDNEHHFIIVEFSRTQNAFFDGMLARGCTVTELLKPRPSERGWCVLRVCEAWCTDRWRRDGSTRRTFSNLASLSVARLLGGMCVGPGMAERCGEVGGTVSRRLRVCLCSTPTRSCSTNSSGRSRSTTSTLSDMKASDRFDVSPTVSFTVVVLTFSLTNAFRAARELVHHLISSFSVFQFCLESGLFSSWVFRYLVRMVELDTMRMDLSAQFAERYVCISHSSIFVPDLASEIIWFSLSWGNLVRYSASESLQGCFFSFSCFIWS